MLPLEGAVAGELAQHAARLRGTDLRQLLQDDPGRGKRLLRESCGLELDLSRQRVDGPALEALLRLARDARLEDAMRDLQGGAEVNATERRAALHTALRAATGERAEVDRARERMRHWCERLQRGEHRGFDGAPISDVVNIGIGGSDLGPRLVAEALRPPAGPRCHFVANIDPDDLRQQLRGLDPARTLFIVCSKSFRTEETRVNAEAARRWLHGAGAGRDRIGRHFIAVSSNLEAAADFGIPGDHCLPMWDWVGGRFSLWSAVGLSAAIAIGWERFEALLAGARAMDRHAREAPAGDNLPLLSALFDCWNCHFLGAGTLAVLPYAQRLARLPDFLQQLVMESNGKRVAADGSALPYHSAPVIWGSAGTIGQHSFHQLLHQGTRDCPLELLLPLRDAEDPRQHARLVAHCLAQSSVFVHGRSEEEARASLRARGETPERAAALAPHLAMPGNRPHSLLSFETLTPALLGALLALWEHRTFYNARLLGINAFDQWGVELGKVVSARIQEAMAAAPGAAAEDALDAGTRRLLARWRAVAGEAGD
mgnify:CR=1 FL=1